MHWVGYYIMQNNLLHINNQGCFFFSFRSLMVLNSQWINTWQRLNLVHCSSRENYDLFLMAYQKLTRLESEWPDCIDFVFYLIERLLLESPALNLNQSRRGGGWALHLMSLSTCNILSDSFKGKLNLSFSLGRPQQP